MFEKACQLYESNLSEERLCIESALNIQSSRTTSVAADVAVVKADVSENSVMTHEEKDGRVNIEYVFFSFNTGILVPSFYFGRQLN